MPSKPFVALVGMPSHHPMVPEGVRDDVKKQLALVVQQMEDAGYSSEVIYVTPEDGMDKMTQEFKSRPLDGIVIGFGIRGIPQNTFFFEQVVEAVRRGSPKAILMFNTSPESTVDAAKRWFKAEP
ncbi:hypothetical protein WJX74_007255 [Apatococcus lobatus]|uniref:LacI family transcriptional regulator n=1 Tax=Apatococcus lobatus TaxID=904363 RepID=A0AAW1RSS9_9CHLO